MMEKSAILIFLFAVFASTTLFADTHQDLPITDRNERMKRMYLRETLINQGIDDMRKFKFDIARRKFLQATEKQYLNEAKNESSGRWALARMLIRLGEYEEVLEIYKWHDDHGLGGEFLKEENANLNARIAWKNTGEKKPIYDFIEEYKKVHRNDIPPKRTYGRVMATVAELYDLIGDYDAGIAWAKMFRKADKSEPLKRTRSEYDSLIQAFEESKRGMPKVCSDDGKYCVGRATAYIIQSDQI